MCSVTTATCLMGARTKLSQNCMALACALALLLLPAEEGAQAQVTEQRSSALWVSAGLGATSSGIAGGLGLAYRTSPHIFSARAVTTGPLSLDLTGVGVEGEDVNDFSLLYGRGTGGRGGSASISAGIGLITGTRRIFRGGFRVEEERIGPTVGIPIEAQLFWIPGRDAQVGLGLTGLANLNREASFAGALVSFHLTPEELGRLVLPWPARRAPGGPGSLPR